MIGVWGRSTKTAYSVLRKLLLAERLARDCCELKQQFLSRRFLRCRSTILDLYKKFRQKLVSRMKQIW
jgi:hypothetical protein